MDTNQKANHEGTRIKSKAGLFRPLIRVHSRCIFVSIRGWPLIRVHSRCIFVSIPWLAFDSYSFAVHFSGCPGEEPGEV